MRKEKQKPPIKVINIMKSGRIVEDMSTVTMPIDVYENVMKIFAMRRHQWEKEAEAAAEAERAVRREAQG